MLTRFLKSRRRCFCVIASGAAVLLLSVTAAAQSVAPSKRAPGGLTAVAVAAYQHSPALMAARQALRATQELYPQALALYQPQIGVAAGITNEELDNSNFGAADGATTKDAALTFDQPLYRGGRSRAQKNEAKARIRAQKEILAAAEQRMMADAMLAAVNAAAAAEIAMIQQETETLYQRLLGDTQRRVEGGEATGTDRAQAQSRLSGATADRLSAEDNHRRAMQALERLTGMPAHIAAFARLSDLRPPAVMLPTTLDAALVVARADNPDRQVLLDLHDAENHGIELVAGELLPQLRFLASWSREWDPAPGLIDEATSRQAGLRLTLPLYEGGGTRARVRAAKYRHAESRYELQDYDLVLAEEISNAWRRQKTAAARQSVLDTQVQQARIARDNIAHEIQGGEKTMTDLLQADQTWLDAQIEAITVQQTQLAAEIELMRLTGLLQLSVFGLAAENHDLYIKDIRYRTLSTAITD